jgi:HEAT repeat protein
VTVLASLRSAGQRRTIEGLDPLGLVAGAALGLAVVGLKHWRESSLARRSGLLRTKLGSFRGKLLRAADGFRISVGSTRREVDRLEIPAVFENVDRDVQTVPVDFRTIVIEPRTPPFRRLFLEVKNGEIETALGDEAHEAVVMEASVRALTARGGRLEVSDGALILERYKPKGDEEKVIRDALEIARRVVSEPPLWPEYLLENATSKLGRASDRARAARLLVERFRDTPEAHTIVSRAHDLEDETQLAIAIALPEEESFARLVKLALEGGSKPISLRALRTIIKKHRRERVHPVLLEALRSLRFRVRLEAFETLSRAGDPPELRHIACDEGSMDVEDAIALAEALGARRDPAAETTLLRLVASPDHRVALAAGSALGLCGSAPALPPLRALARAKELDPREVNAVEAAILRIESRLPDATPGGLSLSDDDPSGALSLAHAEPGELSLVSRDRAPPK